MSEPELYRILCAYFAEWYPGVIPERIVVTDTTGKKYAMTIPLAVRPGFAKPEAKKVYTTSEPENEPSGKQKPRQNIRDAILRILEMSETRMTGGQITDDLRGEFGEMSVETMNRTLQDMRHDGVLNNSRDFEPDGFGRGYGMVGMHDGKPRRDVSEIG